MYKCSLTDYTCSKGDAIPAVAAGRGGGGRPKPKKSPRPTSPKRTAATLSMASSISPSRKPAAVAALPDADSPAARQPAQGQAAAQGGGRGGRGGRGAAQQPRQLRAETPGCRSFDGKWKAIIENYNVFLRPVGSNEPATPLSFDGSEGNYYTLRSVAWSPDSKKLVAYHTRPGYDRQVHYIQSSPADQVQPKHFTTNTLPNAAIRRHVSQARRRARYRIPGAFRRRHQEGNRNRSRAVSESLRHHAAGLVEGQPRLHLRIQPARPPGLSRHRSGCADRQDAARDR